MANQAPKSSFDPAAYAAAMQQSGSAYGSSAATAPAKEKATVYLQIGTPRDDLPEDATAEMVIENLINLPQLIGLDNMKHDERKASTQAFADEQAERNEFLDDLVEEALSTLEPGETRIIPLYVTLYRKKDDVVAAPPKKRVKRSYLNG